MGEITNTRSLKRSIVFLRILIGWHFLYEGIIKLYNPDWTALGYLSSAQGPFKQMFFALANQSIINWIDGLNMAALIIVGLTFILGFSEKKGAIIAIGLLAMYYLAHPPFPGLIQINTEGNYWFVNKNIIELAACLIIYHYPTGKYFGLDRFFNRNKKENK